MAEYFSIANFTFNDYVDKNHIVVKGATEPNDISNSLKDDSESEY
jgi:hypothetical protein